MSGYRREESSDAIDEEGWYYTGDLAVMDAAGYVRIVGRKRDLIIRGGHNVVPLELERVLEQHPGVARAAVVGVPDRMAGERIVAFFVPAPGACPGAGELRAHCARSLAAHRLPDYYRALAALPVAASGEVLKSALRQVAAEERIGG
jgi:acyl-CoA synthetase (AMP-forming)/AMP-acid ligase II